jgi:hypothetical protein
MATTSVGLGWLEILLVLLGGGGLFGTPPGMRDASLIKAAPQHSVLYFEWAARGAGQSGAPGIDGFAADPEVRVFFDALDKAIVNDGATANSDDSGVDERNQTLRREIPRLVKLLTAHAGCLFVGFDPAPPGEGLLEQFKQPDPLETLGRFVRQLRVGIISSAGEDVPAVLDAFNQLVEVKLGEKPQMDEVSVHVPPVAFKLTVHRESDRLFVGFGQGAVEKSLAGIRGEMPGLDTNPRFQAGWQRVAVPRVGTVGWVDLRGISDTVTRIAGPAGILYQAILRGAGADAFDFALTGTGVVDGNVVQRTFVATGGRSDGMLVLAGGLPIRPEQLRHIPADSDLVAACSLNLGQVIREMRDLLGRTTPLSTAVFDEAVKQAEAELGMTLQKDILPAIGDVWTAFDSPSEGGVIASSLIVSIEIRDVNKARALFEKLMQLTQQSLSTIVDPNSGESARELKEQEILGHRVFYVQSSGFGFDATPRSTPTFCLTQNHFVYALHPQAMKAHLRYLANRGPGFDAVANGKLPGINGERIAFAYLDGKRITELLSTVLPFFGQAILPMTNPESSGIDTFVIPSAAALVPYARDVTFAATRQKDGLLCEVGNPQIAMAFVAVMATIQSMLVPSYDGFLAPPVVGLQQVPKGGQGVPAGGGLGVPEGQVVPAAAEKPAPVKPDAKPGGLAEKVPPLLLKALIPDGVQQFIPDSLFRQMSQPPSEESLKQREERKKQVEERKKQLEERRRERAEKRRLRLQP